MFFLKKKSGKSFRIMLSLAVLELYSASRLTKYGHPAMCCVAFSDPIGLVLPR